MYYQITFALFFLLPACNPIREMPSPNNLLYITAKCRGNDQCTFDGQDIVLDIGITNNQPEPVEFPLAFLQSTGPIIKLVDSRTQLETNLKTNLADFDLREQWTVIPSQKTVTLEWIITAEELQQFNRDKLVDLTAEVTVKTTVRASGKKIDFQSSDALRIIGKAKS